MSERGHTLLEMVAVLATLLIMASVGLPYLKAYSVEAHLIGAGRVFKGEFLRARSIAVRTGAYSAIRFEPGPSGPSYSIYVDGNHNGVLNADIASGQDRRVAGPIPLNAGASDVRVGINPGVPNIPPETGYLDPKDPIRFGPSNILSFSPLGTATPGTFYLAGETLQAGVRVTGGSARVRLMICRGRKWVER
jgi:type II secretory pathway pseudopilin PulG